MTRPACLCELCNQGRRDCPCKEACQIADDHGRDDMVFNRKCLVLLLAYLVSLFALVAGIAWWLTGTPFWRLF